MGEAQVGSTDSGKDEQEDLLAGSIFTDTPRVKTVEHTKEDTTLEQSEPLQITTRRFTSGTRVFYSGIGRTNGGKVISSCVFPSNTERNA